MKVTKIIIFIFLCVSGNAQDAHFSQFFVAPSTLNPAYVGNFNGTYRLSTIYRDQWRSAVDDPFATFIAAGDVKFYAGEQRNANPDFVGAGIMFYSDRVSTFDLNTTQISLSGAYHKSLDRRSKKYLSIGFQGGIVQKSVNYEDLTFQDQWNALNGYTLATGELLPPNNFAVGDFGVGINYYSAPSKYNSITAGIGLAHVSSPNVSFYQADNSADISLVKESALKRKLTAYLAYSMQTSEVLRIEPRLLYLNQDIHQEINLGTNFRYHFLSSDDTYLHFGPWIRGVKNVDNFGIESIVASLGIEYGSLMLGFSYDYNLSDLTRDRKGLSSLEFSITYLGDYINDSDTCPKF